MIKTCESASCSYRHLPVPAAVLGAPLTQPPGLSPQVVLRVQLSSLGLAGNYIEILTERRFDSHSNA